MPASACVSRRAERWCASMSAEACATVRRRSRSAGLDSSERSAEPLLQLLAITAAQGQTGAVFEKDDVFPVEPGLQLLHALDVDDVRAVDPVEHVGVQPGFEGVH